MGKKLLIILSALVALLVIAALAATFFLGGAVTKAVNTFGPKITGTEVKLDSASISAFTGGGSLKGLFVGNPQGWKSDKAFYLGEIRVSVSPTSLLGDHIVVKEIHIDQPEFVYETNLLKNNISELLKQIEANTGGSKTDETKPAEETKPAGPGPKFVIQHFRLQGAKVTLGVGAAAITVPMPPLTIDGIGESEGGITSDQAAAEIMEQVLSGVTKAAVGALTKAGSSGTEGVKDVTKKASDGLKKLFGKE